jgi:hypothetical protein
MGTLGLEIKKKKRKTVIYLICINLNFHMAKIP